MKHKLFHLLSLFTVVMCAITATFFTGCDNDEPTSNKVPEIWASCDEIEFDYKSDVTKSIWIFGDIDGCQVTAGADWLANSYIDYDKLVIKVTENTSSSSRVGNLFVFNPNGGNSLTIKVKQSGNTTSGDNNNGGNNGGNTTKKLATPTGVKAANIGTSKNPVVQISWNSVPNATKYRVIKTYPKNGGYEIDGQYCSTSVLADTGNEYVTDNLVEAGTAYEYQVMAAGSGYENSNWSAIVRINL